MGKCVLTLHCNTPAMTPPPQRLIVLTEHFNATFWINFGLLFDEGRTDWQLQSLDAESFEREPARLSQLLAAGTEGVPPAALVLSRYHGSRAVDAVLAGRAAGVPVLFHLDDWLFELPASIGAAYTQRYDASALRRLDAVLSVVDAILCSTPALHEQLQRRLPGKTIHTLVGVCYRPYPGPRLEPKARLSRLTRWLAMRRQTTIGYAGSNSHQADLEMVVPALLKAMAAHPTLRFECLGLPVPAPLRAAFASRVSSHGYTREYPAYIRSLYEARWTFALCPLVDHLFNRCKTATKLVEYAACGVPALVSALDPYVLVVGEAARSMLVPGSDDWGAAIAEWLADPPQRRQALLSVQHHFNEEANPAQARRQLLKCIRPVST